MNEALSSPGRRIVVVGVCGAGKTTFARRLAASFGYEHIELDALNWGPDWRERPVEEFRARLAERTAGDGWVADGNYGKVRDVLWPRADTIVWLDYPLVVAFRRLLVRTVRRVVLRERLWHGNRERFAAAFLSRESLFVWLFKTYRRRKREYPALLAREEYRHLRLVWLRSVAQAHGWLAGLAERPDRTPATRLGTRE